MKKSVLVAVLLIVVATLILSACFPPRPHRPGRHAPVPHHVPLHP